MSGRQSRDKGARTERATQGIASTKISGLYRPGADISVPLLGGDHAVEVKCRATGFRQLCERLNQSDVLVKANRQEASVVLRVTLAAEIAKGVA
jgi:hypothetical protein